jgi:hypothetical protein
LDFKSSNHIFGGVSVPKIHSENLAGSSWKKNIISQIPFDV